MEKTLIINLIVLLSLSSGEFWNFHAIAQSIFPLFYEQSRNDSNFPNDKKFSIIKVLCRNDFKFYLQTHVLVSVIYMIVAQAANFSTWEITKWLIITQFSRARALCNSVLVTERIINALIDLWSHGVVWKIR